MWIGKFTTQSLQLQLLMKVSDLVLVEGYDKIETTPPPCKKRNEKHRKLRSLLAVNILNKEERNLHQPQFYVKGLGEKFSNFSPHSPSSAQNMEFDV